VSDGLNGHTARPQLIPGRVLLISASHTLNSGLADHCGVASFYFYVDSFGSESYTQFESTRMMCTYSVVPSPKVSDTAVEVSLFYYTSWTKMVLN
jgi:hypothetical protein